MEASMILLYALIGAAIICVLVLALIGVLALMGVAEDPADRQIPPFLDEYAMLDADDRMFLNWWLRNVR